MNDTRHTSSRFGLLAVCCNNQRLSTEVIRHAAKGNLLLEVHDLERGDMKRVHASAVQSHLLLSNSADNSREQQRKQNGNADSPTSTDTSGAGTSPNSGSSSIGLSVAHRGVITIKRATCSQTISGRRVDSRLLSPQTPHLSRVAPESGLPSHPRQSFPQRA